MEIYCGNNALDPGLIGGDKTEGTPYECFRKGIGVGMNLPPEEGDYAPLYDSDIFCGKEFKAGQRRRYRRPGYPYECLQKGVGVGKGLGGNGRGAPPEEGFSFMGANPSFGFSNKGGKGKYALVLAGSLALAFGISFALLWGLKPKFVQKKDKRSTLKITLYGLLFAAAASLVATALFFFWARN